MSKIQNHFKRSKHRKLKIRRTCDLPKWHILVVIVVGDLFYGPSSSGMSQALESSRSSSIDITSNIHVSNSSIGTGTSCSTIRSMSGTGQSSGSMSGTWKFGRRSLPIVLTYRYMISSHYAIKCLFIKIDL